MGYLLLLAFLLHRPTPLSSKTNETIAVILFLIYTVLEYFNYDKDVSVYSMGTSILIILYGIANQVFILRSKEKILYFRKETTVTYSRRSTVIRLYLVHGSAILLASIVLLFFLRRVLF